MATYNQEDWHSLRRVASMHDALLNRPHSVRQESAETAIDGFATLSPGNRYADATLSGRGGVRYLVPLSSVSGAMRPAVPETSHVTMASAIMSASRSLGGTIHATGGGVTQGKTQMDQGGRYPTYA